MNLLIGAGVVIAVLSGLLWVQTERVSSAKSELRTMEESRDLWVNAADTCSKLTEEAAKEADKRARTAQDALKKARIGSQSAEAEITRLRGLKPTGEVCLAGQAVARVREGLKQ